MQRARKKEDKEARRRAIVEAALDQLDGKRFAEVKMSDVARAAGLAKGTVFLYFPTKEALFLDIFEELLAEWLTAVSSELDRGKGRWTVARVARVLCATLMERTSFVRLLGLLTSVLERNVEVERVVAFKSNLALWLGETGASLERRLDFLGPGEGGHLLMRVYALVVGVDQLCDPGEVARQALERPELAALSFDFETELHALLVLVLEGLRHRPVG